MSPLGVFARGTPGGRTTSTTIGRVERDANQSPLIARALLALVERLEEGGQFADPEALSEATLVAIRDALRQLTARVREGALLLRVAEDELLLDGVPASAVVGASEPSSDLLLHSLLERLHSLGVGAITIREGAAPGELLTLARWITRARLDETPVRGLAVAGDTPTSSEAIVPDRIGDAAGHRRSRELLRTWSVLVTPRLDPNERYETGDVDDVAWGASSIGTAIARLTTARATDAATSAATLVAEAIDAAEVRRDVRAIERIARALASTLRATATSAGRIALEALVRRMHAPATLPLLARALPESVDPWGMLQLLSRAGDAGAAALVERLLDAEDAATRRTYFDGIVAMDVGAPMLFDALRDERWYVVRNVAALLGEMGVERADRALVPLLAHADDRIRIAAARALMRLRTPAALTALQGVIGDANAEVRRLSAAAYGATPAAGTRTRPSTGPLAAAFERETDDDVALEMLAALGKLGSSDAVQRLLRIAMGTSSEPAPAERNAPRPSWMRIAALEALLRARGRVVLPAVEELVRDEDAEVADAARRLTATDR